MTRPRGQAMMSTMATDSPDEARSPEEARKVFGEELQELRADVIRLAALVTEAIAAGTEALLEAHLGAAERVVEPDAGIDELAYAIEDHCFVLLARHHP